MRPIEGLLAEKEQTAMLETLERFGGHISHRAKPDGSTSPYEANISLFDALKALSRKERMLFRWSGCSARTPFCWP